MDGSHGTMLAESKIVPTATIWHPPLTCLPTWETADLPAPTLISWQHCRSFIGPVIVMMGVQIGGGEWLSGPEITARFGGGLMWLATIAIVLQVFYNLEVGRYALFCGEPIFTGFMRSRPGPLFWVPLFLALSLDAMVPCLAFHAASVVAAIWLDRARRSADVSGTVLQMSWPLTRFFSWMMTIELSNSESATMERPSSLRRAPVCAAMTVIG